VLLDAARMLEPHDPRLARDTLLDAYGAARYSGQFGVPVAEVLAAVRAARRVEHSQETATGLLLDGFAAWGERRYEAGVELLRRAIAPLTGDQPLPDDVVEHFTAMSLAASRLYDWPARQALERRWAEELRRRGALSAMLVALVYQANNQLFEGRFADAEVTLAEGRALSEAMGFRAHLGLFAAAELTVLAWRGREADARALAAQLLRDFAAQGHGLGVIQAHVALTWLEIGLGNYHEAWRGALEAYEYRTIAAVDVVEAGIRCRDVQAATAALESFSPMALATGNHITLGLVTLGRALLADDNHAESEYLLAIEHFQQCPLAPYLARSYLLYGEWLRRQRRRRDAREQLRTAWQMFDTLGMEAFAERARAELRATGEHARKRSIQAQDALTSQEAQIAWMAADGASNTEIAARLFISASTVEYHLRKVFRKLGITSRVRLAHALSGEEEEPVPQD